MGTQKTIGLGPGDPNGIHVLTASSRSYVKSQKEFFNSFGVDVKVGTATETVTFATLYNDFNYQASAMLFVIRNPQKLSPSVQKSLKETSYKVLSKTLKIIPLKETLS